MTHVTVGNAIDWQQMNLDQSVRSIRMWIDKERDLYAVPVIVIDPTSSKVSANGIVPGILWESHEYFWDALPIQMHVPPVGMRSYIIGIEVSDIGSTLAVAGLQGINVFSMDPAALLFQHGWWAEVNPAYHDAWQFIGDNYVAIVGGIIVSLMFAPNANGVQVRVWGYDA